MMQKDKSIEIYRSEFKAAEQQYNALYKEIRAEQNPFADDNPRREEFIHRMTEVIARFYKNYDNLYGIQMKEAAEIERIKFKNRY